MNEDFINELNSLEILTNINPNIQLWNLMEHDINVAFITNQVVQYPFDKYIFVSNWQKNRFIQQYRLDHNKCITMQNGISPLIKLDELKFIKKEKTYSLSLLQIVHCQKKQ